MIIILKKLLEGYKERFGVVADNNIKNKNQSGKLRTSEEENSYFTIDKFPGLSPDRLQWAISMTRRGYVLES